MHYLIRLAQPSDIEWIPTIEKAAAQQYLPYLSQLDLTPDALENLVPEHYTPSIRTIVNHEERYGFRRQVRVVMQCQLPSHSHS